MQFREVCYTVVSYAPYILLQIYTITNLATFWVTIFDFLHPGPKPMTVQRRCFFCGSFMLFPFCVCYAFMRVYLSMPCGHLLGKCWPVGSRLWCLIVKLSLSHWYTGSSVMFVSFPDLCPFSYFEMVKRKCKIVKHKAYALFTTFKILTYLTLDFEIAENKKLHGCRQNLYIYIYMQITHPKKWQDFYMNQ